MKYDVFRLLVLLFGAVVLAAVPDRASRSEGLSFAVNLASDRVSISGQDVEIRPEPGESFVLNDKFGEPQLPYRVVRVILPARTRYSGLTVSAGPSRVLSRAFQSKLAPAPVFTDGSIPAGQGTPRPVTNSAQFPGELVRYLGTGYWHGHAIASFAVYSLQTSGTELRIFDHITANVQTEPASVAAVVRPARSFGHDLDIMEREFASSVINPEMMHSYPEIARVSTNEYESFEPTSVPSLEGSPVEYLIVTTDLLASEFQKLADWKTAKGVPAVVRTTSWIKANYRHGSDDQETIRAFIADAYVKWGVRWVLIGGDVDQIAARFVLSYFYDLDGVDVPADLYYAGLDGTWNDDHDGKWGEMPDDNPDLYSEVKLGRLPASRPADVAIMVDKIKAYALAPNLGYNDDLLFLAEMLFPNGWKPPDPYQIDGAGVAEWVIAGQFVNSNVTLTKLYENYTEYPGSYPESRVIAIDSINAGYGHIFHIGHGYRFNMHVGDDNITIPDADGMTNSDFSNLFMLNCTAAAFDYDCLAEHLLLNPNGGVVSAIGASNSALVTLAAYYMDKYAERMFVSGGNRIGEAFTYSREIRAPLAIQDNAEYWGQIIYVLLADPEMPLFVGPASAMVVSHPDSVDAGLDSITVDVTSGGSPVDSAVVCLWKAGEEYKVLTTGPSGVVTAEFNSHSAGPISVVVTTLNKRRYQGTIEVRPPLGQIVTISSVTVDDDSANGTYGNGDGLIDAGETVDLMVEAANSGTVNVAGANLLITTNSPGVAIIDSVVAIALIPAAGTSSSPGDPWRVHVLPDVSDETVADFAVVIADSGGSWQASFSKILHRPELEIETIRFDDAAPYGNGDGVLADGEQFLLYCKLVNYGTGTAYGLSAQLVSIDGGASIASGVDSYGDLEPLDKAENLVGFSLNETSTAIENLLQLTITDLYGNALIDTLELRAPAPPSNFGFDASLGIDLMGTEWGASPSPDVNRYNLYVATTSGGPYTRSNTDPLYHATYTATGLLPSTRYYFVATAIDSSGNESVPSVEGFASTNPPQQVGWPNHLVDGSANSPALGDIDGNGQLEVVVGNNLLYAWHHDGIEVRDGDAEVLSWGVFSDQGADFIGPAALAALDAVPGLEIIAAAYTSKEVYCFSYTGAVLPGWPQATLDNVRAGVVVGDIDGDGAPEILAIDQNANLYAWHKDGSEVRDGDSNVSTNGVFKQFPNTPWWQYQSPSVADLDGDGSDEIVVCTMDSTLYVLDSSGNNLPGWPRKFTNFPGGGVAIGDIDDDGDLEIVIPTKSTEIYALHHDNTQLWLRWVQQNQYFCPSPALADINGDGKLETFLPSSTGWLTAIDYQGNDIPGWPVRYSDHTYSESSAIIADVSGDGLVDIILGDESRYINAWDAAGNLLDGFPLVTSDAMRGTPSIADLDWDGDLEIVAAAYDRSVYVWDLTTNYHPTLAPWPMFHADIHNSGVLGLIIPTAAPTDPAPRLLTGLRQNYPNPFNPATTIAFELARPAARASLIIYDVSGARIKTVFDGAMKAGRHTRSWNGTNQAGAEVGSGVYFYRLLVYDTGRAFTNKMVLLK